MIEVRLYGQLGRRFGRRWQLNVRTIGEALRAIDTLKGGLFQTLSEMEAEVRGYQVTIDGREIDERLLDFPTGGTLFRIVPLLRGADTKGIIQIVAGVALIALGFVTYGTSAFWGIQLAGLGLAVALGGVARLLMNAPPQTIATQDKTKSSYIFTGPVNTIVQGECVPVAYGAPITGSGVISAGVETDDVSG